MKNNRTVKNKKRVLAATTCLMFGAMFYIVASTDELSPQKQNKTTLASTVHPLKDSAVLNTHAQKVFSQEQPAALAETPKHFKGKVFASSIEGAEIDGRLKSDANGNLILDLEVRDLFDYFMNTAADVSPEIIFDQLEKLANENLPEKTVRQVMSLLEDYISYKESAMELMSQDLVPEKQQTADYQLKMLENSFEQLKDIRRHTMSAEAVEAFFYLEEAYGSYTLASIKIQNNETLSAADKAMQLSLQRQQLPEIIQRTESRMIADTKTSQEVDGVLNSNKSDLEIETLLKEKGLSSEAISSALDYRQNQHQFETQYQLYRNERKILTDSGLSVVDQNKEIESLRLKYFTEERDLTQAKVKDLSS